MNMKDLSMEKLNQVQVNINILMEIFIMVITIIIKKKVLVNFIIIMVNIIGVIGEIIKKMVMVNIIIKIINFIEDNG